MEERLEHACSYTTKIELFCLVLDFWVPLSVDLQEWEHLLLLLLLFNSVVIG